MWKKKLFHHENHEALESVAQRGCPVSILSVSALSAFPILEVWLARVSATEGCVPSLL